MPTEDPWPPATRATGRARPPGQGPKPDPLPMPRHISRPVNPGRVYGGGQAGPAAVPSPRPERPVVPISSVPASSVPASSVPASSVPVAPGRATPPAPPAPPARGVGVIGGRGRPIRSHGRRKSRLPAWALVIVVLGLVAVGAGLRFVPGGPFFRHPAPAGPTLAPLPLHAANITVDSVQTTGFLSWAVMDRRTGEIFGSSNLDATSDTASLIKAWMAAEYLRNNAAPSQSRLNDLEIMVRDSDNDAADRAFDSIGGTPGITRMVSVCSLTDSQAVEGMWSNTVMSARDVVRLGQCIADGRAAGPKWTQWLVDAMRKVRGEGDFGIRQAFPAAQRPQIAIKNGWLLRDEDNAWHTSCLAIGDTWVLSVMQRYPSKGTYIDGFNHTTGVCQNVTKLLMSAPA